MAAPKTISATEAARSFSDVVARVRYRGETFIVEKSGEAVCQILPAGAGTAKGTIGDVLGLLDTLPPMEDGYRKVVRQAVRRQSKVPRSPWE